MSTGFAGSRSMDERRRRRLASESSESLANANDDSAITNARTHRFAAGQFPLRSFIFHKRWKLSLYYLPVLLCFAGLIAADFYRPEFSAPGSALSDYLSLKESPLPQYLTGVLLFVSGQIALLIAALRTQSLHDFSGRYRLWKWIACSLFLFALCTTTQLHQVWANTVIELRLFDWGAHTPVLAWLVPAIIIGLSVSLMTYLEMRGDRAGLNFTVIAIACYVASLTILLTGNLLPWENHQHLIEAGIRYFGHLSLFIGLLLHTHHLLYQSVDLPKKEPSRFKGVFSNYLYRRHIKRKAKRVTKAIKRKERLALKAAQKAEIEAAAAESKPSSTEPEPKTKRAPSRKKVASKPKVTAKVTKEIVSEAPQEAIEPTPEEEPEEPVRASNQRKSKSQKKNIRVDSSHDPQSLKGLSKRERRKLQKQWREEQRQNASQNEDDWS